MAATDNRTPSLIASHVDVVYRVYGAKKMGTVSGAPGNARLRRLLRGRGSIGAVREVLTDGWPSRGASTITMQVAKNLFLWQGLGYLRKPVEIVMAHGLELVWTKRRIMEVYLNVAEWGDGLFGAEAAAQADLIAQGAVAAAAAAGAGAAAGRAASAESARIRDRKRTM